MTGVPVWQSDKDALACPLCQRTFSIYFRRHHCRKCGRVVCSLCSDHNVQYLPTTYVVSPPNQPFLESPLVPHRTCDECFEELDLIREALAPAPAEQRALMVQDVSRVEESLTRCPICSRLLVNISQQDQESHVDSCLQSVSASPGNLTCVRNRMVIYKLPRKEVPSLGECVVCFDDFLPSQSVGRLECLCVFHERCILGWFAKKGTGRCPVHNQ